MQIVRVPEALRSAVAGLRAGGGSVALVPTMGALHAGHRALIEQARQHAASVVVSIFVNPTQFGPNEDLAAYPRDEAADVAVLEEMGCDLLWAPSVATMYPAGFATTVAVAGITDGLDGAARPGHFAGVATVVTKLFNQVRPDLALFGEKDFQQLAAVRRLVRDLDLPIDIVGVPTVREADGLALSSRNAYLTAEERRAAVALPDALRAAAAAIAAGEPVRVVLEQARARLGAAGFGPIDYVALCDAVTLVPVDVLTAPARLLAAARLGRTRLIDNFSVGR